MKKREFTIAIDELTYLKIDEIARLKYKDKIVPMKTDNVLLMLYAKAMKEFIMENQDLVNNKLASDLYELDCRIEAKGFDASHIFADLSTSAKEGD